MISRRFSVILFIVATIAATALTIEGTFYVITHLAAFYNPNDPLAKAHGLSQEQERSVRGK